MCAPARPRGHQPRGLRPLRGHARTQLAELERAQSIPPVSVVDVDSDPELTRRFGIKVPVLLLDGSVICHYTLNSNRTFAA